MITGFSKLFSILIKFNADDRKHCLNFDIRDLLSDTVFYSDRFREILGYSSREFPGTINSLRCRLHPDDNEVVWAAIQRHLQERVPYKVEYRLQTRSGEYLWFLALGQAIWNAEGKAIRGDR